MKPKQELTLRDYFASCALQALVNSPDERRQSGLTWEMLCARAYAIADAMLAERAKK